MKQARRDSNIALSGGQDQTYIANLVAKLNADRMQDELLVQQYGQKTQYKLNSRERDNELLKEALASAKKKYGKMKPKVNTRNPLYQKHFFENMRLAEHVR